MSCFSERSLPLEALLSIGTQIALALSPSLLAGLRSDEGNAVADGDGRGKVEVVCVAVNILARVSVL